MPVSSFEEAVSALFAIPSDISMDDWVRCIRAMRSEFGESAHEVCEQWSQQAECFNAQQFKATWRNAANTQSITIGTLFYKAKEHGWQKDTPYSAPATQKTANQSATNDKGQKQRERRYRKLEAQYKQAISNWKASPYIAKKIPPKDVRLIGRLYGARYSSETGGLIIPRYAFSESGRLTRKGFMVRFDEPKVINGQPIKEQSFIKNEGDSKGTFAIIGQIPREGGEAEILEGVATGWSVYAAHRRCIFLAFTANNLAAVANAVKAARPDIQLTVAADNDPSEAGRITAKATGLRYRMPDFSEFNLSQWQGKPPSDFNDLHQLGGLETVRRQLNVTTGIERHVISRKFLGCIRMPEGLTAIKSRMGSGKTQTLQDVVLSGSTGKTLIISHRVMLNEQLAGELKADVHHDLQAAGASSEHFMKSANRLVCTSHSLYKLRGSYWDTIIIDEAEQVITDIATGKLFKNKRAETLGNLAWMLRSAKRQILLDAGLSDVTLNYCEKSGLSGQFIQNTLQREDKPKVYIYKNRNVHTKRFLEDAQIRKLYFASNSKAHIEGDKTRKKKGLVDLLPDSIRRFSEVLSGDTKGDERQDILLMLKHHLSDYHRILFATPAAGTGLNISKHDYQACYGDFVAGQNTVEDCMQHISRVRNLKEYHLHIATRKDSLPTNSGEIRRRLYELEAKEDKTELIHTDYQTGRQNVANELLMGVYCDAKVLINQSQNDFKGRFIERLKADGFEVIEINSDEDEVKALAAQKKTEEINRIDNLADAIHAAPILPDDEYTKGQTKANAHSWVKTHVVKCLGSVIPEGDNETLSKYALAEIENGYLSNNLKSLAYIIDDTFLERQSDWVDDDKKEIVDKSFPKQVRRHTIKLLSYAGISPLLEYDGSKWLSGYLMQFQRYMAKHEKALVDLNLATVSQIRKATSKDQDNGAALAGIIKKLGGRDWVRYSHATITKNKQAQRVKEYFIDSSSIEKDKRNAEAVIKAKVDL